MNIYNTSYFYTSPPTTWIIDKFVATNGFQQATTTYYYYENEKLSIIRFHSSVIRVNVLVSPVIYNNYIMENLKDKAYLTEYKGWTFTVVNL